MTQSTFLATLADRMTASYLIRLDSNERTKYCSYGEAQQIVGGEELENLLISGEIDYIKPRTDCAQNAKWKIRRLHCFMHVKPVENSTQKLTLLANNI